MFHTNIVEEIKYTYFLSNKFYLISCRLCDNVEKYCRADRRQYGAWNLRAG